MHGRVKERTSEERQKQLKKEREQKQIIYRDSMTKLLNAKAEQNFANENIQLAAKMLVKNPDIVTIWNYRKEAILFWDEKKSFEGKAILDFELDLTYQSLKANPKSYGAWYHRFWVLKHFNGRFSDWKHDYDLCNRFVVLDDRNFHCWDYRRLILPYLEISNSDEIKFTDECLKRNFSNYSALYHRSLLLDKEYFTDEEKITNELRMFSNAIFTDPKDSSAWIYYKWYLSQCKLFNQNYKEIFAKVFQLSSELLSLESNSKWCLIMLTFVCNELENHEYTIADNLKKLIECDPKRKKLYEMELNEIRKQ